MRLCKYVDMYEARIISQRIVAKAEWDEYLNVIVMKYAIFAQLIRE